MKWKHTLDSVSVLVEIGEGEIGREPHSETPGGVGDRIGGDRSRSIERERWISNISADRSG